MYKSLLYVAILVSALAIASMLGVLSTGKKILRSAMSTASGVRFSSVGTPYSTAYVTVPNDDVAKTIARGLVQNKLAACVNIIPKVTSVYEWEGSLNEDTELLLMIKTRTSRIDELTKFVKENHPYSVCEVISTLIDSGNPPYLDWIGSSVPEILSDKEAASPASSSSS